MKLRPTIIALALIALAAGLSILLYVFRADIAVLHPAGLIALKQRNLMLVATLLMFIVVVPVFVLTFFIAWKYREGNTTAKYEPEWTNRKLEIIWWGVPIAIIAALGVIIVQSSHDLDPYKPITSTVRPITIQVVALQWKWLFVYPEQNIASVNYVQFPAGTPVNFEITGDAPMNSFWIPRLGGQVYAMAGMRTSLHLIADHDGSFNGSSANISGVGFAGMKFVAKATSASDFNDWVASVKKTPNALTRDQYIELAKPSQNTTPTVYSSTEPDLYDKVVMKYMAPVSQASSQEPAQ
jgi:cytochrome o ubiquinol oxidase subunit 2